MILLDAQFTKSIYTKVLEDHPIKGSLPRGKGENQPQAIKLFH